MTKNNPTGFSFLSESYFSEIEDLTDDRPEVEVSAFDAGNRDFGFLLQMDFCHIDAFKNGVSADEARNMLLRFHDLLKQTLVMTRIYRETGNAVIQLNNQKYWNRNHKCLELGLEYEQRNNLSDTLVLDNDIKVIEEDRFIRQLTSFSYRLECSLNATKRTVLNILPKTYAIALGLARKIFGTSTTMCTLALDNIPEKKSFSVPQTSILDEILKKKNTPKIANYMRRLHKTLIGTKDYKYIDEWLDDSKMSPMAIDALTWLGLNDKNTFVTEYDDSLCIEPFPKEVIDCKYCASAERILELEQKYGKRIVILAYNTKNVILRDHDDCQYINDLIQRLHPNVPSLDIRIQRTSWNRTEMKIDCSGVFCKNLRVVFGKQESYFRHGEYHAPEVLINQVEPPENVRIIDQNKKDEKGQP